MGGDERGLEEVKDKRVYYLHTDPELSVHAISIVSAQYSLMVHFWNRMVHCWLFMIQVGPSLMQIV